MRVPASRDYATSKVLHAMRVEGGVLVWNERPPTEFEDAGFAKTWNTRYANRPVALKINKSGYWACPGHSATIGIALDTELERCGWKRASRIFDRACNPALPQDEFDRLMREFRNISDKWRKK